MNLFAVSIVLLVIGGVALYLWLRIFNSPDGERYMKQRIQGPFVPTGEDKHE